MTAAFQGSPVGSQISGLRPQVGPPNIGERLVVGIRENVRIRTDRLNFVRMGR